MKKFHAIRMVCVLGLGALVSACASYHYQGSTTRKPGTPPGMTVEIELVPDGEGCRKKVGADALYGYAGQTVTWNVTNHCGKQASVHIHGFKEKKKTFGSGVYPFVERNIVRQIDNNGTAAITATVLKMGEYPPDAKGFHVYTYKFSVTPGHDTDPEIIIEWP